jgi:hypothetical protein
MKTARYAATGFALGAGWGVLARVWMRLISTSPEFTWVGTLSIVLTAAVIGLTLGVVHAARRRGGSRWWRLLALSVPVLFLSPGIVLFPAAVVGGWGLRRGPLGRLLAALAVLSAPVILVVMSWQEVETTLTPYPENVFRLVLAAGGLVLGATAAWGTSGALGPWPRREPAASEVETGVTVAA